MPSVRQEIQRASGAQAHKILLGASEEEHDEKEEVIANNIK